MAVIADQEYDVASRLQKCGWNVEFLDDNRLLREIAMWAGSTLGYRRRDLNPLTLEHDGRWDGGVFPKPICGQRFWVGFRDEQDYLMFKLKFSS